MLFSALPWHCVKSTLCITYIKRNRFFGHFLTHTHTHFFFMNYGSLTDHLLDISFPQLSTGLCVVDILPGTAAMMGVCGAGAGLHMSVYTLYIEEEFGLTQLLPFLGFIYVCSGIVSIIFGPFTGKELKVKKTLVIAAKP